MMAGAKYVAGEALNARKENIARSSKKLNMVTGSEPIGTVAPMTNLYTEKQSILGKITGNYTEQNPEIIQNTDQLSRVDQQTQMTDIYGSTAAKIYEQDTWGSGDRTSPYKLADHGRSSDQALLSSVGYDGTGEEQFPSDRIDETTGVGIRSKENYVTSDLASDTRTGVWDPRSASLGKIGSPDYLTTPDLDKVGSNITAADKQETFNIQKNQLWGDKEDTTTLLQGLSTKLDEQYGTYEDDMAVDNQTAAYYSSEDTELPAPTYTDKQLKEINENAKQSIIDRSTDRENAQFTESVNTSTANLADADMAEALAGQTSIQEAGVTQTIKEDHDLNMQRMILDQESSAKTYSNDKAKQYKDRMDLLNRKEGVGKYSDPNKPVETDFFRPNEIGSLADNRDEIADLGIESLSTAEEMPVADVSETISNIQSNTQEDLANKAAVNTKVDLAGMKETAGDAYSIGKNIKGLTSDDKDTQIQSGANIASTVTDKVVKKESAKFLKKKTEEIAAKKLEDVATKKLTEEAVKTASTTGGTAVGTAAKGLGGGAAAVTGFYAASEGVKGYKDAAERGDTDEAIAQGVQAAGGAVAGTGGVLTGVGAILTATGVGAVIGAPMMAIGGAMTTYGGIAATAGSMYTIAENAVETKTSGRKSNDGGSSRKRVSRSRNYGRA
jgi:hypothetical protein